MSFLSKLGKIGAIVGPIAASFIPGAGPGAGGLLSKIGRGVGAASGALGQIGKVAGETGGAIADQRYRDAQLALLRSQLEHQQAQTAAHFGQTTARDTAHFGQQGARDAFSAGLQGAQFGSSEQQRGMRNALLSQLMGGLQDAKLTGGSGRIPTMTVSGGLRPSVLDAGGTAGVGGAPSSTRAALMAALSQPTLQAPQFTPGAPYEAPDPYQAPAVPGMPQAGLGEKVLGGVGLFGGLLGTLDGLAKKKTPQPTSGILNPKLIRNVQF